ncbi:MAG TPA: ABC transporter substrate-binding protein [Candidatus Binatia bacterium]|jgi:ABC-type nitrate/sulfonate/bicarbonate transport system substrate-binding protein|nr:ABC transporter substrate-binding protein [Candidatus Binatia bacterium]
MKLLNKAFFVVLLILSLPPIALAQQYMIGYAGFAGFQVSMWAAKDLGLLKKYGLEGETVLIPGTSRQIQALVGDSIHFAHVDAAGHIRAVMRGADIVMVAASLNKFPFSLVTVKEIRKPEDLIGKKIGIVGFGGANDLAVTLLLREWKIARDKVTVLQAGGGANRLVALSTKALDATVLSHPELGEALRMGMNELGNLDEFKSADYPMSAVAVRRSFMVQNRDVVRRFVMAYTEATYQFMNQKEKGIAIFKHRLKQDNPKALEETYKYFAPKFSFPTRVSHNGLQNTLELIAKENPKLDTKIDKYVDESILNELEKEGFFKKIAAK